MSWQIRLEKKAKQDLAKLDATIRNRIFKFLYERVQPLDDPRSIGESLKGSLKEYWKYRVGDYRLIISIQDDELILVVIRIGHRSIVYKL